MPPARQWWTLLPFLVAVTAVAGLGGLAAAGSQATYRALDLPPFAPPSWLFGPVWSSLYALLAIVPLWLRHDAEREERPAESAGRTARHGRPLATPAGLDQQHRIGPRDALVH